MVARNDQSRNIILKEILGITQKNQQYIPKPVRRLYIPKKDGTKRPLGIPIIKDRVMQAIVENVLYPYTESQIAKYDAHSYGFRKGVSTFDAISSIIARLFKTKSLRIILDGDFRKCFDNISHENILEKAALGMPKTHLKFIKGWLEAGHIEIDGKFYQDHCGTPQGGIISPTLCNLVLNELHKTIKPLRYHNGIMKPNQISIHRYADDFICIMPEKKYLELVQTQILKTVKPIGLELHPDKTKTISGEPFQFLGYEICQSDKWIAPPKESIKKCYQKIKDIVKKENYTSEVVAQCNPILRGVYNYYAPFSTQKTWERFNKMEFEMAKLLKKKFHLYWIEGLVKYKDVKKKKHQLVKLGYSTLNFDDTYWLERGSHANINPSTAKLYQKQKGLCPICRGKLQKPWNIHHQKTTLKSKKRDDYNNLKLLHLHCHKEIHKGGTLMNNCLQKLKLKLPRIKDHKPTV